MAPMTFCAFLLALVLAIATSTEVYVMMPLNEVTSQHTLKNQTRLGYQLDDLAEANVDGIMLDVWWGLTEQKPKVYNFNASRAIVDMARSRNLKVQIVTSFHQCGGNVGDICDIPLPEWLTSNDDIFYKDKWGNIDKEYVSLFADHYVLDGRSILDMYQQWFEALAKEFADELGSTIKQIQVGMGPCGELRYPAYYFPHWEFCGIGAFQCYDVHALESLRTAAYLAGRLDWQHPPKDVHPPDATDKEGYRIHPKDSPFFQDTYTSDYGKFFLDWYFSQLKRHAAEVLSRALGVFKGKVEIAGKIAGIHWFYKTPNHAAEVTAGYYNTNGRQGYEEIADVFANYNASVDFTCLEMLDKQHEASCECGPEELVGQVYNGAMAKGITFNGENALAAYSKEQYETILSWKSGHMGTEGQAIQASFDGMHTFTYLRLGHELTRNVTHFTLFKEFVQNMHGTTTALMPLVM